MYGNLVLLFPLLCSTAAALQMTGPSTYTASVGSIAHIPCTFTADKLPADIRFFAVVWYLEGKIILSYDNTVTSTDPRYSLEEDRALNGNAALTISNTSVSDGGDYTCSVIYSPLQMEKKIRVDITAIPTITMVNKVVTVRTKSSLNSTISGFYPARIDIKWLRDGEILNYVAVEKLQRDPDGTYSVNSSVTITPTEEDREQIFSCRVQHKSLTAPLQEDFRLVYSARPLIFIPSKRVQRNIEKTLTCTVSGFFPSDIVVTWYKDGEVLKDPLMGETRKYDNGTFQVNSTVTITPSDDDQNKTFSCRVQHVSLQEPLQEDFPLIYDESSSLVVILCIVVPAVVIIAAVIIGIILWKRKCRRKAAERASNYSTDTIEEEERDGRKDCDYDKSNGDKEEAETLLSTNKEDEENSSHPATNRKHSQDKLNSSTQETAGNNSGSRKQTLPPTPKNIKSPDQPCRPSSVTQTPTKSQMEGDTGPVTPPRTPHKDHSKTPENKDEENSSHPATNRKHSLDKLNSSTQETAGNNSGSPEEPLVPTPENVQSPHQPCTPSSVTHTPTKSEMEGDTGTVTPPRTPHKDHSKAPENRQLPYPKIGEITVPGLIAGKKAELSCKLYNYILGEHKCSWYVKLKSTGEVISANSDTKKLQTIGKDETSDDQNTSIAYLAFVPVEISDDGSEFILRVDLPDSDRVIERSTTPVHVKGVEENSSNATNTKRIPIKPSLCTEESGSKSLQSPEQPLLPKEKGGQPFGKQTPKKTEDKSSKTVTPAKRSASLKENPNTPENRQLPDLEVGEITVPDLIGGKRATLSCKLYNYILGEYECSWHVKLKSTGDVVHAGFDGKKLPSIKQCTKSDDQNTSIALLALSPVEISDDGSEFILRVDLPDRVIERSTGPIHVKGNPRHSLSLDKRKNEVDESTEEGKDQSTDSPSAENRKPQSSDQEQICKPVHEEQPQCPVTVEEEDNNDIIIAMKSYSSNPEPGDKEECIHLDNMEAEDPIKISPHSPYGNPEGSSLRSDKDHKEDQFPESQKHEKEENPDNALPIDISSSKLEGGDQEESANLDNMDAKDLAQKSELSMKMEKEHKGEQSPASQSSTQEKDSSSSSSTSLTDEEEL